MKNIWSLLVTGSGEVEAAKDPLAHFVSDLRSAGIKIQNVSIIDGTTHDDFENLQTGDPGWCMTVLAEGDMETAYRYLPTLVTSFNDAGISFQRPVLVEGALRQDLLPAYA